MQRLQGMEQPFDKAVTAHGGAVLRVCRSVLGPGTDADDAWQETFVAALRAWPRLAADANVEAWLVRIASRKAIDAIRARRHLLPLADPDVTDQAARSFEDELLTRAEVLEAVAGLPPRQRLAVTHHHLAGLPYDEVAQLIGGRPDAARRAASDGMTALRRHFGIIREEQS